MKGNDIMHLSVVSVQFNKHVPQSLGQEYSNGESS